MFGINLYRKREKLKVDIEIQKYRSSLIKEVEELALQCAKEKGEYEHTWHSNMETLRIEIAKLEAIKEMTENDIAYYKRIITEKDNEIGRQHVVNLKLAEAQQIIIHK